GIDAARARRRYAGGGDPLGNIRPSGDGGLESGRNRGGRRTQEDLLCRAHRGRRRRPVARTLAVVRGASARELRFAQSIFRSVGKLDQAAQHRRRGVNRGGRGGSRSFFRKGFPLRTFASSAVGFRVSAMRYFPIYLDLKGRKALVVGGGAIAEGKALQLIAAGARVTIVSPGLTEALRASVERGEINHRNGSFIEEDLNGVVLVISATDDRKVNEEVANAAAERGLLRNVVDQPDLCDFITPALVTRGELQISVSTGGGSPTLTQRVKREVAALIGEEYGALLEIAAEMRAEAKDRIADFERRKEVLRAFVESDALDLIRAGKLEEARELARNSVKLACEKVR